MGDRANIVVKSGEEQVVLYSHWGGHELPETLRAALERGRDRWDDFQYLTRIIFCQMVPVKHWNESTDFGITGKVYDNERPIITVNADENTVQFGDKPPVSFEAFVGAGPAAW